MDQWTSRRFLTQEWMYQLLEKSFYSASTSNKSTTSLTPSKFSPQQHTKNTCIVADLVHNTDNGRRAVPFSLSRDVKPFCVRMPQSVTFPYRDKLHAELELLQEQGIMKLITEPTSRSCSRSKISSS